MLTDKEKIKILSDAIEEMNRRAGLLIHQNTGRWDMRIEHDARSYNVTESNIRIGQQALEEIK